MQRRILLVVATSLALVVILGVNHLRKPPVGETVNSWALFSSVPQPNVAENNNEAVLPWAASEEQELDGTTAWGQTVVPSDNPLLDSSSSDQNVPNISPEAIAPASSSVGSFAGNALPLDVAEGDQATHEPLQSHLKEEVYPFQADLNLPQPTRDLSTLAKYRPHNLALSGRHPTYATYFASRSPSIQDPYFMSTQQVIYRTLWSPATASPKYPFTVFVAPFVTQQQRDLFRGAGANVIELPLIEYTPVNAEIYARWKDLFSRLHMWNQTQFTRIAFLDGDAFPLQQGDDIFEAAQPQKCVRDKLDAADLAVVDDICDYVFAGVQVMNNDEINMAVAVFAPNQAMHARLLRNMDQTDKFDNAMVEQAYLSYQFERGGAFPKQFLARKYNGFYPQPDERWSLKFVHEKLWIFDVWGDSIFENGNAEMIRFYDSEEFAERRKRDGET